MFGSDEDGKKARAEWERMMTIWPGATSGRGGKEEGGI